MQPLAPSGLQPARHSGLERGVSLWGERGPGSSRHFLTRCLGFLEMGPGLARQRLLPRSAVPASLPRGLAESLWKAAAAGEKSPSPPPPPSPSPTRPGHIPSFPSAGKARTRRTKRAAHPPPGLSHLPSPSAFPPNAHRTEGEEGGGGRRSLRHRDLGLRYLIASPFSSVDNSDPYPHPQPTLG